MTHSKSTAPLWMKILLVLFLLIFIVSGIGLTYLNTESKKAKQENRAPQAFGYSFLAVGMRRATDKYPNGSLILMKKAGRYLMGDNIVILSNSGRIDDYQIARAVSIHNNEVGCISDKSGSVIREVDASSIIGKIDRKISNGGTLYQFALTNGGILTFLVLPAAVCILWIFLLLSNSSAYSEKRKPKKEMSVSEKQSVPEIQAVPESKESFDVFQMEEPDELSYLKEATQRDGDSQVDTQPLVWNDSSDAAVPPSSEQFSGSDELSDMLEDLMPSKNVSDTVASKPVKDNTIIEKEPAPAVEIVEQETPAKVPTVELLPEEEEKCENLPYIHETIYASMDDLRVSLHGDRSLNTVEIIVGDSGKKASGNTFVPQNTVKNSAEKKVMSSDCAAVDPSKASSQEENLDSDQILEEMRQKNESFRRILNDTISDIETMKQD